MDQLRNWSFRVGAALAIAVSVLVVSSLSQAGYSHSGCTPPPCKTTVSCSKAKKPWCLAPATSLNCRCQCSPGLKTCVCLSIFPR
jgi:hypothetical protein